MRMSKAARADWEERFHKAGDIYTQAPCGCVMFILVDMPEEVKAAAKEIAEQVMKGREIRRVASPKDLPPHYCPEHAPEGWKAP